MEEINIRQFYVYVIDLDTLVLREKKFKNANPQYEEGNHCVYVGQSYLKPKERFEQHKNGIKSNKYARKYGKWVKKKNIPDKNPHPTRAAAEKKEKEIVEILKNRGWAVWSN